LFFRFDSYELCLLDVCEDTIMKNAKCEWVLWQNCQELQSALLMKCMPIPGETLNTLMCIVPLMVPILRPTEVLCLKKYQFFQYTLWLKTYFILLSQAKHSVCPFPNKPPMCVHVCTLLHYNIHFYKDINLANGKNILLWQCDDHTTKHTNNQSDHLNKHFKHHELKWMSH
jgi:hypothetical protein